MEPAPMLITVLLFASYADSLGVPMVEVELPRGATVLDALQRVRALPGAGGLPAAPMLAVNQCYAVTAQTLAPGDEVAIIPPVAGG